MTSCSHCDENILVPIFDKEDKNQRTPFCCNGCLTVFNILHQKGLENYYDIKKQSSIFKRRSPVDSKKLLFSYIDQEDFISEYTYKDLNGERTIEFYLEGIHCLACLWLIEKLPDYLIDVKHSRLDMNRSVATITIKKEGKFSSVARELNNLGYKPHALKRNQDIVDLKRKEERQMLLKIGIAGAGAGNIMLYAVSNYAGAGENYASVFNYLTLAFAAPVLFFSASPFYKNAWNAIKTKTLSIDIPISMSLILGTVFGFFQMVNGITENYLDSLTALIFLLLLSRYFLNKIQGEGLSADDLSFFHQTENVLKKVEGNFIETHQQYIKTGDIIKVSTNQMISSDGYIVEGSSSVNNSLLTGESKSVHVDIGTYVFSGTLNIGTDLLIRVEKTGHETRLGKILKQVESGWIQKSHIVEVTNRVSKYFLIGVILLASVLFIALSSVGQYKEGLERAITLLIVTCPCALALATPLTLTRTLSLASRKGMIIKDDEVIEKLSQIDQVYFDKTGTITFGQLKIIKFNEIKKSSLPIFDVIASLEKTSLHPVAMALKEYSVAQGVAYIYEVVDYHEILGSGVIGTIENKKFEIKKGKIFEENILVAEYFLEDQVRPDSKDAIRELKELQINVSLISGDQEEIVSVISNAVNINSKNYFFDVSPENKLKIIEDSKKSLMVGDGANDAMALSKASVGVAVMGAMDISLRAADIYLTTPGISAVVDLIVVSRETMKVIYRNLILSIMYNSFSVYAAYTGLISPLVAAIIMPISSLTVLFSTLIGTKKLNNRLCPELGKK